MSALSAGDLSPSNANDHLKLSLGPLNAALLWRQAAKAAKAVTNHRTPKLRAHSYPFAVFTPFLL
jgi:hypothetical protein